MMHLMKRGRITDCLCVFMVIFIYLETVKCAKVKIVVPSKNVCSTKECKETAARIRKSMNRNVSPCNNFYQFVCGDFDKDRVAPIHGYDHSVMSEMGDHVKEMVEYYLETKGGEDKNKPFSQAFDLFEACSNQDALKAQGITPLEENLVEIGGWPLVEGVEWEEIRWENITEPLAELGYDTGIFFDLQVVQIDGPTIQLRPAEIKEFTSKTWEKLMVVATKLGADPDTLPPVESRNHLHSFDTRPPNQDSTVYLTVDQMITRWPSIDWMTYFSGVASTVPNVTITGDQHVIAPPEYIDELVKLLKVTPAGVIMNYVAARVVEYSLRYLSPDVTTDPQSGIINIEQSPASRRTYCAHVVTQQLPLIIEAIFEVNYVDDKLRNTVMNLSFELKDQLGVLISKAGWLDDSDKDHCVDKLHKMKFDLGYPEDIKDGYYTDPYIGLEIDKNNFLQSMLNNNRFKTTNKYVKSIENEQTDTGDDRFVITSVNALYNPSQNKMDIMPGILQDPFINEKLPKYITYSGIGFVLGHEATHGFDIEFKIFEFYLGVYPPQAASKKVFRKEVQCVSKQFQDYIWKSYRLQINGNKFATENIADDGGTKVAFKAYEAWVKENGPEPTLPGLNYNLMQTFWIALAHTQCGKYNPHMVPFLLSQDSHGLHEFRINAPFSNNPDFAKTFNCPLGSPMNPKDKCVIW